MIRFIYVCVGTFICTYVCLREDRKLMGSLENEERRTNLRLCGFAPGADPETEADPELNLSICTGIPLRFVCRQNAIKGKGHHFDEKLPNENSSRTCGKCPESARKLIGKVSYRVFRRSSSSRRANTAEN